MQVKPAIAEIIAERLEQLRCQKTAQQIAEEAGLTSEKVLRVYCQGAMRVPLTRAWSLARALDLDPKCMMRLCVEALMGPEVTKEIAESFGVALNKDEHAWLEFLRQAGGGYVPPFSDEGVARASRALAERFCDID